MDDTNAQELLVAAINASGGLTKVAYALGISTNRLANWLKRGVPAERCPDIEAATGIRCELLRPDVNWQVLRAAQSNLCHRIGGDKCVP